EATRVADVSIDGLDCFFDRALDLRRFGAAPFEPLLNDLLFPGPFFDPLRIGFGSSRQVFQCRSNALEFGIEIFVPELLQVLECKLENVAIGAGGDWEKVLEIAKGK